MKLTRTFSIAFAIIIGACLSSSAQTAAAPKLSKFDAELAKRLGADKMGMRKYVLALLKTGPAQITDKDERAKLFKGHFEMINHLAKEGKLAIAGPFSDGGEFRGLYIFNVETIEEAKKLTETDPSIKAGIFKVDFIKWYGSAALMEVNSIHDRISQENP